MRSVLQCSPHRGIGIVIGIFAIAALLSACGSSAPVVEEEGVPNAFPNHTPADIREAVHGSTDTLTAFEGEVRMDLNSPMQSGRFRATLRQRRSDTLWMNVRGPLGIDAARMMVTPDSFYVHNRIDEELAVGPVESAQQVLPVPVSSETLFQNLMGLLVLPTEGDWSLRHDDELYHLEDAEGRYTYSVDPSIWRVVRFVERDEQGTVVDERVFTDHTRVDGVLIPSRVVLRRPGDGIRALMTYRSITLTPESLSFPFDVPSDVQRVALP
ncbi:MAG: DUF4292 domain-containing protein [Longimonas sp.]|uniref:DUF4292 domain-containing protein n=1 Tax=Longimonas sp. TaxID=2039626 RepID=UPI003976EA4C